MKKSKVIKRSFLISIVWIICACEADTSLLITNDVENTNDEQGVLCFQGIDRAQLELIDLVY